MVPTLLGKEGQEAHDYLYWEFHERHGKRAVLKDDWKLVKVNTRLSVEPKIELYNLEKDPGEMNDVASAFPEIVSELAKLMDEAHVKAEHPGFRFATQVDEVELQKRLKRTKPKK